MLLKPLNTIVISHQTEHAMYNPNPNDHQGNSTPPNRNQGFDALSKNSPSRGDSARFQNEDRTVPPSNVGSATNPFVLPFVGGSVGNSASSSHGHNMNMNMNMNMNPPHNANASAAHGGFVSQNLQTLQAQPNAAMMMINPQQQQQQLIGGIYPLNIMGLLPGMVHDAEKQIKKPKKRRKKPKDRPKRPLSAYNLFFKDEREKILKQIPGNEGAEEENEKITWPGKKRPPHGKISFEELAKTIGTRWKSLDEEVLTHYKKKAEEDLERYAGEMRAYEEKNKASGKASPLKQEDEEDDVDMNNMKDDVKRPRDEGKDSPGGNWKRKKNKKLPKQEQNMFSVEMINQALQSNLMAMKMGGNIVFPMILNPGVMNMTQQQSDQFLKDLQAQQQQQQQQHMQQHMQQLVSQTPHQQAPTSNPFDPIPPQQMFPGTISQSQSFGLGENELLTRPDSSSQQLMGYNQHQHQHLHHDGGHKSGDPSMILGDRDNSSSNEFNYSNLNLFLNDQGNYPSNYSNFSQNTNGSEGDENSNTNSYL